MEDEKVVEAVPSLGFVHRGLELLCRKKTFSEMISVAERICGICSFVHGLGPSQALERIMKISVPERALFLRVFWSELSRIQSHLLWLGLAADACGFESLFMNFWRIRESVLDIIEATTGGRIIFGACRVGGVRRDIADEEMKAIAGQLKAIETDYRSVAAVFLKDATVASRLAGVAVLSRDEAHRLGAVGPTARGSGLPLDLRRLGYAAYSRLAFEPVVESEGDAMARGRVRAREVLQSFDLIRQAQKLIPSGPVFVQVAGFPQGEYFARLEQPRGEVVYYLKGNGTAYLDRFRVRTPTFANLAALITMLQGCELSEVGLIVLSIDPCISCTER
jgi:ech hydrogenase subunit E